MYDPALYLGDYRHMTYIPPAFLLPCQFSHFTSKRQPFYFVSSNKKRKEKPFFSSSIALCLTYFIDSPALCNAFTISGISTRSMTTAGAVATK